MSPDDPDPGRTAVFTFMRAEVLAARLEAMARAEPEVGNLWRSELALAEAVATVGLEGIRISEADLLPRVARNGGQDADPTGAELALGLIAVMKAPGDPLRRPVELLRRFERLAGRGGGPEARRPEEAEIAAVVAGIARDDMPILSAAHAAARLGLATGRANPMIERLVFMAVEGALRGQAGTGAGTVSDTGDVLRGLSGRVEAGWIAPPALALSHGRFRAWSPGSAGGLMDLGTGLGAVLGAEIGRFGLSRAWLQRGLAAARGRGGRSRLADAVRVFGGAPVLTSALLAEKADLSIRGALNILEEMTALGLLREITHRRTARIWAVPGIGARLAARPRRTGLKLRARPAVPRPDAAGMERVFEDLDAALGRADALLPRSGGEG